MARRGMRSTRAGRASRPASSTKAEQSAKTEKPTKAHKPTKAEKPTKPTKGAKQSKAKKGTRKRAHRSQKGPDMGTIGAAAAGTALLLFILIAASGNRDSGRSERKKPRLITEVKYTDASGNPISKGEAEAIAEARREKKEAPLREQMKRAVQLKELAKAGADRPAPKETDRGEETVSISDPENPPIASRSGRRLPGWMVGNDGQGLPAGGEGDSPAAATTVAAATEDTSTKTEPVTTPKEVAHAGASKPDVPAEKKEEEKKPEAKEGDGGGGEWVWP